MMLQAMEGLHKSMGLEGIEHQTSAHQGSMRVQMWLRKSLNEQALGSRLLHLCRETALLEDWFEW